MTRADDAVTLFRGGFSCSQAVLAVYAEDLGLDRDAALRVSTGLGAGISRTGRVCGAASGAILVIGLAHGKTRPDDNDAREKTYTLVQRFIDEYSAKHGSIDCTDLIGYDLSNTDGYARARDERLFLTRCPVLVGDAVEILERIL
jgi:C_GCAxxG_C_C family probable redox protein